MEKPEAQKENEKYQEDYNFNGMWEKDQIVKVGIILIMFCCVTVCPQI